MNALESVRLFLHVLAASVWVGGQILLGALVPTLRSIDAEAPRKVARAFNRIAWPAFGLLVITGIWNVMSTGMSDLKHPQIEIKFMLVIGSGVGATIHARGGSKAALAIGGAAASLCAVGAMYVGVLLAG